MSETSCVFCRILSGELSATIVYQDSDIVAFEDLNPQAPTHVLVIPRKHIATLNDLEAEDEALIGRMIAVARDVARERGHAEIGYRAVFNTNAGAGQTVFHIHLHLLGGRSLSWPPG